jgi:hypothetical protein
MCQVGHPQTSHEMAQGELFHSSDNANVQGESAQHQKGFGGSLRVVSLDKILLICVGLLALFVLVYSFGVERGRRTMEKEFEVMLAGQVETIAPIVPNSPVDLSTQVMMLVGDKAVEPAPATLSVNSESQSDTSHPDAGSVLVSLNDDRAVLPRADTARARDFTIQLVTYTSENQAIREIENLKKRGFSAFVIPSGKYLQVCTNYFANQSEARKGLQSLAAWGRYPDAYIRPVVR